MEETILSFEQIEKRRHNLHIGPLNLKVPAGCVTAIVGMNGSGKSSLVGMMLGTVHPDQGAIFIKDQRYDMSQDREWKQRLGYVAELPNGEDDDQTPEQLAKQYSYWYSTWDQQWYQKLIARYEIDSRTKLNKMSKGMRRKAEIILALSHRPEVLLLDEPTSGLDPISWRMMIEDLQQLLRDGKHTIIIATHVIEEVKRLADYILFLHRGKVLTLIEKDALFDAWKEYWLEGVMAEDLLGMPGLAAAVQERHLVRAVAYDAAVLEQHFQELNIMPTRTQAMPLDEVMYYRIRMEDERREL
ncbi:ATP-binding cassette domain-containing protein [Paenibacillus marinisediminis]